uniref:hypothetical protein n=1 Tax=Herbidospora sakaeratensis TaxID=564415 RepID=UPI0007810EB2|nr:hypothetical protein [Herbidospora sakaeratensis]
MTDTKGEEQIRPFAAILQELDAGRVHDALSREMHTLVKAIQDTGKKGTLTLKVEVAPIAPGDTHVLTIKAGVSSAPPATSQPVSAFFVDGSGNLSRNDPRQLTLPGVVQEVPSLTQARSAQ